MSAARQETQELVVQGRRLQRIGQQGLGSGVVIEQGYDRGVLVAQQKLHQPVLEGLKARCITKDVAKLHVFAGGQGFEHRPLRKQLLLNLLDPSEDFHARVGIIAGQMTDGGAQFMNDQLEPQLRGLMLNDEQHLIVVSGVAQGFLCVENTVQLEVLAVIQATVQIRPNRRFQYAFVVLGGHGVHLANLLRRSRRSVTSRAAQV